MYALINQNIEYLIAVISEETHIHPYLDICRNFDENTSSTNDFKRTYRKFYQLNAAKLSEDFCNHYFQILEESRNVENPDLVSIVNMLYQIPPNSKGINAVHFSFSTKLIHTLNRSKPIYDSMVSSFYFFPEIKMTYSKEEKIAEYLRQYTFLSEEYSRIIEQGLLTIALERFREEFDAERVLSDVKVIDTLIWRYTSFLKSGAIRNGVIQYNG